MYNNEGHSKFMYIRMEFIKDQNRSRLIFLSLSYRIRVTRFNEINIFIGTIV